MSEIIGPAGSDMQMFPPTVASFQILNEAEKRPATLAEQRRRRPVGRRLVDELIEFHHPAGGGDLQAVLRRSERGPIERLEIDERVDVDLGFRKQPGTSGKPGESGFPGGDLLRAGGSANSIYCVQVHGWQPLHRGERIEVSGQAKPGRGRLNCISSTGSTE